MKSIRQRRLPVSQRLCASQLGPNVQNTFSAGSAEDERTRNKLYGAWIKERGISCMALSSGYTYFSGLFGSAVD